MDFITLTRQDASLGATAAQLLIVAPGNRAITPGSAIALVSSPQTSATLADAAVSEVAGALVLVSVFTLGLVIMSIARRRIGATISRRNGH